jgi:phenylacetate-CoA ligase
MSLHKNIILPIADVIIGTSVYENYKHIKRLSKTSKDDITKWQNDALIKLVSHAYYNTKYYYNLFNKLNLKPTDIKRAEDLVKLPILTKQDIRENYDDLVPSNINKIKHKRASTGGSTGEPLVYLLDYKSWSFTTAANIFYWEKTGYRYGDKYVALGSSSLFVEKKKSLLHSVYFKFKNKFGLSGVNLSDEACKAHIDFIRETKIRYIYGYASAIYLLALYVKKESIKVNIKAVFPTSEILTDKYRETISEAFNCQIIDCYGARDGGVVAYSFVPNCYEVGYNCIVRIDNAAQIGQGSALLTDLFNYAMPLINYQIGDELIINRDDNNCNDYNGQIINKVLGRSSEIIRLENGSILTGPGFTILFKDIPVEYYCIEKTGVNTITCYIKKLNEYNSNHESLIQSTLAKHMGSDSSLLIVYTDQVKYSKSGKRIYFVSSNLNR